MPCTYDRDLGDAEPDVGIRISFNHRDDLYTDIADEWLMKNGSGYYAPIMTETLGLVTLTDADVDIYRELIFTDPDTAFAFKMRFY